MALKTILFLFAFAVCCSLAWLIPHVGVLGYIIHYHLGPESQWWTISIRHWPIRYSFTLGVVTGIGMILNWRKLHFGNRFLIRQEYLALLFLGLIWLLFLLSSKTIGRYTVVDHPAVKMTKVVVFSLMMTHVITHIRQFKLVLWAFIFGALFLGWEAFHTPRSAFQGGRLESVGGPDFRDANALASYLAALIPIIGVMFLRSRWIGKIVCAVSGALSMNTIVLCRSRASVLALFVAGLILLIQSPKRYRGTMLICLIVAGVGFLYLTDPQFISRTQTIFRGKEERDRSAQSRLDIWQASLEMIRDHPFGVGPGNFYQNIGRYNPQYKNRDAHNTYLRCASELGIPGLLLLLILMANGIGLCRRNFRDLEELSEEDRIDYSWINCAVTSTLMAIFMAGLTGTMLYLEAWWWFLLLPVCLRRCMDNQLEEAAEESQEKKPSALHKKRFRKRVLNDGRNV